MRPSNRSLDQLRPISLEPGFAKYAEGSCLIKCGETHVLCTASVDEKVPSFLRNTGAGLGHGGIRHVAARDGGAYGPRSRQG